MSFINEFNFKGVKRFYQINHPETSVVRAWQGHRVEAKYFYVAKGAFAIAWVKIDDWDAPALNLQAQIQFLRASEPCIIFIPPGFANGLKALEPGSILMVYSNLTLEESSADRWSFDSSLWLDWSTL